MDAGSSGGAVPRKRIQSFGLVESGPIFFTRFFTPAGS